MHGPCRTCKGIPYGACNDLAAGLQWPHIGLPHEFHVVQAIYDHCFFFKTIKKVNLFANFFFRLQLKTKSHIKPVRYAYARPLQCQRPNCYGPHTGCLTGPAKYFLLGSSCLDFSNCFHYFFYLSLISDAFINRQSLFYTYLFLIFYFLFSST